MFDLHAIDEAAARKQGVIEVHVNIRRGDQFEKSGPGEQLRLRNNDRGHDRRPQSETAFIRSDPSIDGRLGSAAREPRSRGGDAHFWLVANAAMKSCFAMWTAWGMLLGA